MSDELLIDHPKWLRGAKPPDPLCLLAGGVAHDFNNLLTVILGNAEALTDQLSDRQQLRLLAEMTAIAARRGAQLTHRLLAFAGCQTLEPEIVDVGRRIAAMDGRLRRALPEAIDIEIVRAGGLWQVEIDPRQFEAAILDLAINARDAMPRGGRLSIEAGNASIGAHEPEAPADIEPGPYVVISVSDTGEGMDDDTLTRAFEPFFTTREVGQGSGLGLSMVYGFTKQSNGHASISSTPGLGTTVRLYFPRVAAEEDDRASSTR